MAAATFTPKIGRVYELDDGRIGTIKFIGRTFFKPGVDWYGFELTADFEGKNNGTVQGTSYFKCPAGKGTFVKRDKIVAMASSRSAGGPKAKHKAGSRETGRNKALGPKYEVTNDDENFLAEKNAAVAGEGSVEKKEGPRDIGRSDYRPEN